MLDLSTRGRVATCINLFRASLDVTGISWKTAGSSATSVLAIASCMMANAACVSCAPGKATRWCSRLMAAHQVFALDPIEKKPLNHFLPGTPVLSFGTAGCNLTCKFCQNWDISKAQSLDRIQDLASPEAIADAAVQSGCRSVAFTYNDPVIFLEYAVDVAQACHERGIKTVAVSAGYITAEPRAEFFQHMDAANIDLKGFTEGFYKKLCSGKLAPVLETLDYLKRETNVWFEITTLLIPGENDSAVEIEAESAWVMNHLGPDVPLHFTAFHPDWKLRDVLPTPPETLKSTPNSHECRYSLRLYRQCLRSLRSGHSLSHLRCSVDRPQLVRIDGVESVRRRPVWLLWCALPWRF